MQFRPSLMVNFLCYQSKRKYRDICSFLGTKIINLETQEINNDINVSIVHLTTLVDSSVTSEHFSGKMNTNPIF